MGSTFSLLATPQKAIEAVELAIQEKNLLMIQLIHLYKFFDFVNYRAENGSTILELCVAKSVPEITQFLIEIGVPTNILNLMGRNYFEGGIKILNRENWIQLMNWVKHHDTYRYNVFPVSDKEFEQSLKLAGDLNRYDENGETLLHWAVKEILLTIKPQCKSSYQRAIELLLDYGADPHLPTKEGGKTPLQMAEEIFNADVFNRRADFPILYNNAELLIARMRLMKR